VAGWGRSWGIARQERPLFNTYRMALVSPEGAILGISLWGTFAGLPPGLGAGMREG
jgi:hypothetical protein